MKTTQTEITGNQYFSIYLSKKNIRKEYQKQILVSIPKMGLIYLPKSTTTTFDNVNDKTGEITSRMKLSFGFDHDYTLFNKVKGIAIETPLKGEELFSKLEEKQLSKEISVGLKLSPITNLSKNETEDCDSYENSF